jgi:hypothetical protein
MTLDRVEVACVVEIESHRYAHSGSDDYTREITRIVAVVDATGRRNGVGRPTFGPARRCGRVSWCTSDGDAKKSAAGRRAGASGVSCTTWGATDSVPARSTRRTD